MKHKRNVKADNYLDYIPVFNDCHSWAADEAGQVIIYVENKGFFNRAAQKLLHKPKVSQIHLDETGSFIIPLMDGERCVNDIAVLVKEHFGEKAEPLYNRLVTYLRTLEQYGLISMEHPKTDLS